MGQIFARTAEAAGDLAKGPKIAEFDRWGKGPSATNTPFSPCLDAPQETIQSFLS